ncbi:Ctr copper transporter family-domain-containing protein [Chaetomium tenue]|uniref:Ctr copper transporter family-domain-containing protein n=1 Tax=Chaetomium tenue TaxID=1854479 RepID=A0ACB7P4D3_9PEZI|nr:Ctr copper transporter family-domain-containing protein [Chaetomium globosum]
MDHGGHGGDGSAGPACKISMLWNWYTIDACFLTSSWQIASHGAFAATCLGVILMVVVLEGLRRLGKEYDEHIQRDFAARVALIANLPSTAADAAGGSAGAGGGAVCPAAAGGGEEAQAPRTVTFRASPLQQFVRALIHAATFGLAYIVMLLAMYYNGYIIICILIGALLGKFLCDWMTRTVVIGGVENGAVKGGNTAAGVEEPTERELGQREGVPLDRVRQQDHDDRLEGHGPEPVLVADGRVGVCDHKGASGLWRGSRPGTGEDGLKCSTNSVVCRVPVHPVCRPDAPGPQPLRVGRTNDPLRCRFGRGIVCIELAMPAQWLKEYSFHGGTQSSKGRMLILADVVDTSTSAPALRAASTTFCVPRTLTASQKPETSLDRSDGTITAAVWKTVRGRCATDGCHSLRRSGQSRCESPGRGACRPGWAP